MSYEVGGAACCILEICCGGEHQIEELAAKIVAETSTPKPKALELATWILANYDLAPPGTLKPFKRAIAELARKYEPEPGY